MRSRFMDHRHNYQVPACSNFTVNYTFVGKDSVIEGVLPSNHALHETPEITTGICSFLKLEFIVYCLYTWAWLRGSGGHLRPRVMAPLKWKLPVGLSLSTEIGSIVAPTSRQLQTSL